MIKKIYILYFLLVLILSYGFYNKSLDRYPKSLNKEVLFELQNGQRNGEGSFIGIKNGTSLAYVYTCFNTLSTHDASNSDICIIKSDDANRKIWSDPTVLIKNHGLQNIMSVSLLREKDNSILIQYLEKNSCNDLRIVRRHSYDELESISDKVYMNTNCGYNVVNNDRLLNYTNKIYTPISRHSCTNGVFKYPGIMELAITNQDDFTRITSIGNDSNITLQEPGIVNLNNDGGLLMWFRNSTNKMLVAISKDLGLSFSKPHASIIKTVPYSPSSIKSFNDDLFIVYNKWTDKTLKQERTPLVLAISKDNLKTINKEYVLENDLNRGYMYTSIYKENNHLILAYMIQEETRLDLRIVKLNNIFVDK